MHAPANPTPRALTVCVARVFVVQGVERLLEFSATGVTPATYSSFDTQRTDWVRHTRVGYEAQQTLRGPMTTAQEVGWHTAKPAPPEVGGWHAGCMDGRR